MRTRTLIRSRSEALRRPRAVRALLLLLSVGGTANKQIKQWLRERRIVKAS